MLNDNGIYKLIETLRKPEMIRKKKLGLSIDQTFIPSFIKRNYNQTEEHKKMKDVVISKLINEGIPLESILIEKRPFNEYKFKPDITLFKDNKHVFIECHYHDGWCRGIPSHTYNNIEKVKSLGKIIICIKKQRRKNISFYIKNHKILNKADEVWVLDLNENKIENFINHQQNSNISL